ncbi:MAG TPA: ABC transporter substrate-binding protein [Solirubrobacterales bacterium]|nr:ABC transporter substrate-binding protein [Solirubrobacterales bacterium]
MNRKNAALSILALIALVAALAGCGGGGSDATADGGGSSSSTGGGDEPTQIRVQHFPGFISPYELAAKLGYLGKLELKQVGVVTGGPESIQAVATDQTDVGGAFPSAVIKLIAAGGPVKAVIGQFGADAQAYSGLYVPEDSSIKTAKDLIGKKIGVNTLGANSEAVIHLWLKEQGLSQEEVKEVELVVIPPVNMEEALKQHQLDGAIMGGAVREKAERDGGVRRIFKDVEFLGSYLNTTTVLSDSFIEDHPQATKELVAGIAKAIRFMQTEPAAKVVKLGDEIADEEGFSEDVETIKYWKSLGVPGKGGLILPREFPLWIKYLEEEGELEPGKVTPADAYTNEFNPYDKK